MSRASVDLLLCTYFPGTLEEVQFSETKLGSNTPNHLQGHTKSYPMSSAPHLTSNNVLLLYEGHLRLVVATCLRGFQALGRFGEIGPKHSQIKSYEVTYEKYSIVFSSISHIKLLLL